MGIQGSKTPKQENRFITKLSYQYLLSALYHPNFKIDFIAPYTFWLMDQHLLHPQELVRNAGCWPHL